MTGDNNLPLPNQTPGEYKTCPFCAETIKEAAVLCRFCGSRLNNNRPVPVKVQHNRAASSVLRLATKLQKDGIGSYSAGQNYTYEEPSDFSHYQVRDNRSMRQGFAGMIGLVVSLIALVLIGVTALCPLFGFIAVPIWIMAYLLPSLISIIGGKKNTIAITMLNVLLGWTLIGWIVCLVWASSRD